MIKLIGVMKMFFNPFSPFEYCKVKDCGGILVEDSNGAYKFKRCPVCELRAKVYRSEQTLKKLRELTNLKVA